MTASSPGVVVTQTVAPARPESTRSSLQAGNQHDVTGLQCRSQPVQCHVELAGQDEQDLLAGGLVGHTLEAGRTVNAAAVRRSARRAAPDCGARPTAPGLVGARRTIAYRTGRLGSAERSVRTGFRQTIAVLV